MAPMRTATVLALLALAACGGGTHAAAEPVAVAPLAAAPDPAPPPAEPPADTAQAPPSEPEPAPSSSPGASSGVAVSTSTSPTISWQLIVRAPDGTEVHHRSDPLPEVAVEGRRCLIRAAGVDVAMSVANGATTQRTTETRELVCVGGPQHQVAVARCTVETANGASTPTIQPATLELGARHMPSRVTLKCSMP